MRRRLTGAAECKWGGRGLSMAEGREPLPYLKLQKGGACHGNEGKGAP